MRALTALSILSLLPLTLIGCSSSTESAAPTCLDVPDGVAQRILDGADSPITASSAAAVSAPDRSDAYLIALQLADGQGVWMTTSLKDETMSIVAVDAVAQTVTHWPSQVNGEKLSITEPGAHDAINCLN